MGAKGGALVKAKARLSGAGADPVTPPRINSFFAGIGGFDLGFQRAGIRPAYHCENDEYCQSVLKRHWPDVPRDWDVTDVCAADLPEAEIWCGGFPCQDVSVARGWLGRDGLRGQRSGLFYIFADLIAQRLPSVVLIENVTGLLNSHKGRDFKIILRALTELGYGAAWRVMNSRYFGTPQSRPRVYICAWQHSVEAAVNALYDDGCGHEAVNEREGFLAPTHDARSGIKVPKVAYCLAATSGRHTGTDWSRSYVAYKDQVRRLTPTECEGLQGFPKGWTLPGEDVSPHDDIDSLRYHALGNAVSVPVVHWIANRIASGLKEQLSANTRSTPNGSIEAVSLGTLLGHSDSERSPIDLLEERQGTLFEVEAAYKWDTGGCAWKMSAVTGYVPSGPSKPVPSRFIDLIEKGPLDDRYFLSPNAAEGILRRVNGQGRTLFAPLAKALERLARRNGNAEKTADTPKEIQTEFEQSSSNA